MGIKEALYANRNRFGTLADMIQKEKLNLETLYARTPWWMPLRRRRERADLARIDRIIADYKTRAADGTP